MPRLSRIQETTRQQILRLATGSSLPEVVGSKLLAALQLAVPCDGQTLFGVDPGSLLFNRVIAVSGEGAGNSLTWLQQVYLVREPALDLTFPGLMRQNLPAVVFLDRKEECWGVPSEQFDILPDERYYHIFHEIGTPEGGILRVCFAANGRWVAGLEMFRFDPRRPFVPADLNFLRMLAPLAGRAMYSALERERALARTDAESDVSGVMLLGPNGLTQFRTPAGEMWIKALYDREAIRDGGQPTAVQSAVAAFRSGDNEGVGRTVRAWTPGGNLRIEVSEAGDDGSLAIVLTPERPPAPPEVPFTWPLTPQERQVSALLLRGLGNKQIAAALVISENTVESHLSHVYEKLDVHGRGELLARFFREVYWPRLPQPGGLESP